MRNRQKVNKEMDKTSPEEVLQKEIQAAREAALKQAASGHNLVVLDDKKTKKHGDTTPEMPDDRFNRRLKSRRVLELDNLAHIFMVFRSKQEDQDGEEVTDKFGELDARWRKICDNFNKKKTHRFTLRHVAFQEKITYLLGVEKEQIKAAEEQFKKNQYDKWWKLNSRHYWFRSLLFRVMSILPGKSHGDLMYKWYCKNISKV